MVTGARLRADEHAQEVLVEAGFTVHFRVETGGEHLPLCDGDNPAIWQSCEHPRLRSHRSHHGTANECGVNGFVAEFWDEQISFK